MARDSWGWEGSYTPPPPLPPALAPSVATPPSAAEPGEARPMSDVFFRDIARTDSVPGAAGLPPSLPTALHRRGAERRGRQHDGGGTSLRPPHYPPHFRPFRRPRRCSRRTMRARVHWRRTVQCHRRRAVVTHSRKCRRWRGGL